MHRNDTKFARVVARVTFKTQNDQSTPPAAAATICTGIARVSGIFPRAPRGRVGPGRCQATTGTTRSSRVRCQATTGTTRSGRCRRQPPRAPRGRAGPMPATTSQVLRRHGAGVLRGWLCFRFGRRRAWLRVLWCCGVLLCSPVSLAPPHALPALITSLFPTSFSARRK